MCWPVVCVEDTGCEKLVVYLPRAYFEEMCSSNFPGVRVSWEGDALPTYGRTDLGGFSCSESKTVSGFHGGRVSARGQEAERTSAPRDAADGPAASALPPFPPPPFTGSERSLLPFIFTYT